MADIKFDSNKTLATINKEWLAKFPYVYIRFVDHPKWNVTHAIIRTKEGAAEFSINAGMNVGTFEARHKDAYGAAVELCYEKNGRKYRSLGEHNTLTLNEFNAFAKSKGAVEIITARPEWFVTSIKEIEQQLDYVDDWNLDNEQVLVLAGDWAFNIAEKYGIYECQNKRTFRPSKYLAFYKNSQINTVFEITNKPYDNGTSANTPEMLAIKKDFPEYDAEIPRRVIKLKKLQNVGPITNDGKSKSGKTVPFTYGQARYTNFNLINSAKVTSELVHGIKGIEIIDTIEIQKPNDAKVDILFVIDNSGSMASFQKSLSDNIDKFISIFANAKLIPDFKIGVITTDNPVPITFNKTSMLNDKTTFISSVKKAIMAGTSGSATEKPLEMANIAVKSNFSRRDAMLFVNIISDENDDSPYSTIHYIEQMKLEKGSKKVTINAIYESSGAKHFEAAKITGGLCATINSEYASLLTNIGTTVMDLIKTYPLSETPRDPLKIEVTVNKKLGANYIYNAKLNSIDFLNPLSPGDILDIVYFIDEKE